MTVTYSLNVANARLCGFSKLLLRWKGSIYKLLYREMIIFCGLYYGLNLIYRYILNEAQRHVFEQSVIYCKAFTNLIPLSFVLGFYVSIVVTRWWQQYMQIPWPDKAALLISGYIHGNDERGRIIRRTLARYLLLMQVLTCQAVSTSVRRRFPTLDHIQEVGLFTPEERIAYDQVIGTHGKWWVPAQWYTSLVKRARKEGRIKHDILMDRMLEELHSFRSCCGMMFAYDWISIPLVYTQTVAIATYTYFLATLMSRQYIDADKGIKNHEVDLYLPVFTILEFFFFMGWLKVAEQLINPYGEDDDDFELNWCLDRNLLVSFTIVDEMHNKHPKLVRDAYWDDPEPALPYTKSSVGLKLNSQPHMGSTINLDVEPEQFLPMQTIMEEDREDYAYSSPPNTADLTNNPFFGFGGLASSVQPTHEDPVTSTHTNGHAHPGPYLNGGAVGVDVPGDDVSVQRSNSRGALKKLQAHGSRLLHLLANSHGSHENVSRMQSNLTVNSAGLEPTGRGRFSQLGSFLLRTPQRRHRTSSMVDSRRSEARRLHDVGDNSLGNPLSSAAELQTMVSRSASDRTPAARKPPPKLQMPNVRNSDRRKSRQYGDLPTAPVLGSNQRLSGMSPILNRLRNSFNQHTSQPNRYRNLDNNADLVNSSHIGSIAQTAEPQIGQNGFRFPSAYQAPANPHEYFPSHLDEQTNRDSDLPVEITISPASASRQPSTSVPTPAPASMTSLINLPEENEAGTSATPLNGGKSSGPLSPEAWASRLVDSVHRVAEQIRQNDTKPSLDSTTPPRSKSAGNTGSNSITASSRRDSGQLDAGVASEMTDRRSLGSIAIQDVYEPESSSSSENLSAYGSNQSTITSYTELIKKDREKRQGKE